MRDRKRHEEVYIYIYVCVKREENEEHIVKKSNKDQLLLRKNTFIKLG